MRKSSLFMAVLCMLAAPLFFHSSNKTTGALPYAPMALAGHVLNGGAYCQCESSPDCVCEPGEMGAPSPARSNHSPSVSQPDVSTNADVPAGGDMVYGAFLLALAITMWLRLRG